MDHLLGGTLALSSALVWAFALILYKHGGTEVPPLGLNLFKSVVGVAFLVPTLWALEGGAGAFDAYSPGDAGILVLSGFLGITLADTLFFHSLNLVGVGIVSIVDGLYTPFILLFSWLLLLERLTAPQYAGAALIVAAIYVASGHAPPPGRTKGHLFLGILLGALSMALMAFGIVVAKPVIERTPLIASTLIRVAAATVLLLPIVVASPRRAALLGALRPSRAWKTILPGSFLGAYVSLLFWMGGFKNTHASVAGILNQTSTVFALILAALFLKERLTRRKAVAVSLAIAGVVLVMLPSILKDLGS